MLDSIIIDTPREKLAWILSSFTSTKHPYEDADKLLQTFGSLAGVLDAPRLALSKVVTKGTAEKLANVKPLVRIYEREKMENPQQIANRRDLEAYCKSLLMGERVERFYVIAVNAQCRLLGSQLVSIGSLSEVAAYPRTVVEAALNMNAHSVFLTHNHPGGTCSPSAEDIASTLQIKRLLNGLGINLLDHIIIAGTAAYSLAAHSDIDFR